MERRHTAMARVSMGRDLGRHCGRVSLAVLALGLAEAPARAEGRAGWMREARWGVMTHYLADWIARPTGQAMTVEEWNRLVDGFDVEGLARQLESVGAGYYVITIGQNSGFYLSPNATYDRLVALRPSRCSRRDLVADLHAAVQKRGIRLVVYLPSGAPNGDPAAVKALDWQNGPYPNVAFQRRWEQVIREWSERWGGKVAGWWFDGCYWPNTMYRGVDPPNFASLAAAARAGNPAAAVAFNPGVVYRAISLTPHEDYTAGEVDDPDRYTIRRAVEGRVDGAQVHMLSYLGEKWGMGAPRFAAEQVAAWTTKVAQAGGVVTWDVPLRREGLVSQPFLDQLGVVGRALGRKRDQNTAEGHDANHIR